MSKAKVILGHGSGGRLTHELIQTLFLPKLANPILNTLDDSAVLLLRDSQRPPLGPGQPGVRVAFTTDSYVVKPLFWPGGDIGRLSVCGTANDLAMVGAIPLYLSAAFILEEGLSIAILRRIVASVKQAAQEARMDIVTGDTKVVEKGGADGLFINTAGVGVIADGVNISGSNARPGDAVVLSGSIGDHGISVLLAREQLGFASAVNSDTAPLNHMVAEMLRTSPNIHALRDPTRGGLATALSEIALQSGVAIRIYEDKIPVKEEVAAACEILGYDPLYVANEGKLIASVAGEDAQRVVDTCRRIPYGEQATIIGEVLPEPKGKVLMRTRVGGTRIVDMLSGEQFPRIC